MHKTLLKNKLALEILLLLKNFEVMAGGGKTKLKLGFQAITMFV